MNDVLTAALEYAERGWYVHPVRGKGPAHDLITSWQQDSTTDPATIRRWFTGASDLGIGVDMGKSRLVAVDGDHLDRVPEALMIRLIKSGAWTHRGNPARMTFVFSENGSTTPQTNSHDWGEVKSDGGYIVMAPSPHPIGGQYVWLSRVGDAPPVIPDDIKQAIAPVVQDAPPGTPWDGEPATEAEEREAARLLTRLSERLAATTENRNIVLNRTALILGHYVPHILAEKDVRQALEDACDRNGLTFEDDLTSVRGSIRSGLKKGRSEPMRPEIWVLDEDAILADCIEEMRPPFGGEAPSKAASWLTNQITAESWADRQPPTPPTVLAIEDTDGALFAKGRISRLFGLSGSAKSWAAKAATAEVLSAGGSVLYLDADGIYEDFRDHMTLLGLTLEDATSGRLHYCRVEGALGGTGYQALLASRAWDLVIVDGLNACLSLAASSGRSGHDAPDVDSFFAKVLHPAADTGAAVVVVDHMRKDGDSDHGSVQKRNNLTGTDYSIRRKAPMAPGVLGYAEIRLTHKDRSGWATSVHSKRGKEADDAFAYLLVDSTEEDLTRVRVMLDLPPGMRAAAVTQSVEADADTLLSLLNEVGELDSNRSVRSALAERSQDMDNSRINAAAERLEGLGLAERFKGKRGALGIRLTTVQASGDGDCA